MAGGYHNVSPKDLANLENDEMFIKALEVARQGFESQENAVLGRLVGVQTQVVAGMNYKMTFNSSVGEYQIVVFCQPWTNTYKITSITPITSTQ